MAPIAGSVSGAGLYHMFLHQTDEKAQLGRRWVHYRFPVVLPLLIPTGTLKRESYENDPTRLGQGSDDFMPTKRDSTVCLVGHDLKYLLSSIVMDRRYIVHLSRESRIKETTYFNE